MISIVIPVYNEALSLNQLYLELSKVLKKLNQAYEIIFVNDGSTDNTQTEIEKIYKNDQAHVVGIDLTNHFGKADALHAGFQQAKGEIIITLDGDLQDDPREIPRFIDKLNEGYDFICGWKQNRQDSWVKNKSSIIFNSVTRFFSKIRLHDFNCGFKAYKAGVAKRLNLYGELHRFIPILVSANSYRIAEIPVKHRKRQFGTTKYGSIRFLHGFFDLITVLFITKFHSRPFHLFGYIGSSFFLSGFLIGLYLTWIKFINNETIGQRPLLLLSVMLMIVGIQIGVTGLVGEQITTFISQNQKNYVIKKKLFLKR